MIRKVSFEAHRVDVFVSSSQSLVFAVLIEALLLGGIYVFAVRNRDYVFLIVLGFFFLAIASAIWPLINSVANGNRNPTWGASPAGLEVPALTTSWTKLRPPIVHEWRRIKRILLVRRFTYQGTEGRSTAWNALVVIFDELPVAESEVSGNPLLQRLRSRIQPRAGTHFKFLPYPKAFKEEIVDKLRELAPASVRVEKFERYEIS